MLLKFAILGLFVSVLSQEPKVEEKGNLNELIQGVFGNEQRAEVQNEKVWPSSINI